MYENNVGYETTGISAILIVYWSVCMAIAVLSIISYWRLFKMARQPGWAALIPFYNVYIILKIGRNPGWWLVMYFIPIANIVFSILTIVGFVKAYGKGGGSAALMIFFAPIYLPYLAFSKNTKYVGV